MKGTWTASTSARSSSSSLSSSTWTRSTSEARRSTSARRSSACSATRARSGSPIRSSSSRACIRTTVSGCCGTSKRETRDGSRSPPPTTGCSRATARSSGCATTRCSSATSTAFPCAPRDTCRTSPGDATTRSASSSWPRSCRSPPRRRAPEQLIAEAATMIAASVGDVTVTFVELFPDGRIEPRYTNSPHGLPEVLPVIPEALELLALGPLVVDDVLNEPWLEPALPHPRRARDPGSRRHPLAPQRPRVGDPLVQRVRAAALEQGRGADAERGRRAARLRARAGRGPERARAGGGRAPRAGRDSRGRHALGAAAARRAELARRGCRGPVRARRGDGRQPGLHLRERHRRGRPPRHQPALRVGGGQASRQSSATR